MQQLARRRHGRRRGARGHVIGGLLGRAAARAVEQEHGLAQKLHGARQIVQRLLDAGKGGEQAGSLLPLAALRCPQRGAVLLGTAEQEAAPVLRRAERQQDAARVARAHVSQHWSQAFCHGSALAAAAPAPAGELGEKVDAGLVVLVLVVLGVACDFVQGRAACVLLRCCCLVRGCCLHTSFEILVRSLLKG